MLRRTGHARGVLGCAVLVAATAALLPVPAGPAAAHASVESTSPVGGTSTATAPAEVSVTFAENVRQPAYLVVTGPGGERFDRGPVTVLNGTVTEEVAPLRVDGDYTFGWRVVSADGHPVTGSRTFSFTGGSAAAPAGTGRAAGGGGTVRGGGHRTAELALVGVAVLGAGLVVAGRRHRPGRAGAGVAPVARR